MRFLQVWRRKMAKKCEICHKRKAVLTYTPSTMSYIHGFTSEICRECFIKMLEKHIKDCQKQLKEQRKLLK
jgi:hypothetical protein